MRLMQRLTDYVLEKEFELRFFNNKLNIVNYMEIANFSNDAITIKYNKGMVLIKGKNLVVSRLMNDEILISGNINAIEFEV